MADWTHVQGIGDCTAAVGSLTLSAITSGNGVAGGCTIDTGKVVTITDNTGANTYDVFPMQDDGVLVTLMFKSRGLITNGPTTFNFNFTPAGTPTNFEKVVDEFAPPTGGTGFSFDGGNIVGNNQGTFNGITKLQVPAFNNLHNDALVYVVGVTAGTFTVGSGFTQATTATNGTVTILSEWLIQSTPTSSNQGTFGSVGGSTLWAGSIAVAPVQPTTWVPIQTAMQWSNGPSGATFSLSFAKVTTKGNIIVGEFFPNSGNFSELQTFVDDQGNNYLPNCLNPKEVGRAIFWSGGLLPNAPTTLSGTLSPNDALGLFMTEFMPPPNTASVTIDGGGLVGSNTLSNAATTVTTPSITTTANGDLIYSSVEPAASTGCIAQGGICCTNGQDRALANGYIIQTTAGAIASTWNIPSPAASNLTLFELALQANPVVQPSGVLGLVSCDW